MTLRQALKMNRPLHTPLHIKLIFALIAVAVLALPHHSHAFTLDTYAESSKLASGKWMKIRVPASGLYCIPVSTLRAWGFSDPAKVRVYGYGGRRIADRLRQSEYIDDLPAVAAELTSSGLVFYAAGPEKWSLSTSSRYKAELNVFSQYGYYFVTESDEPMAEMPTTGVAGAQNPVSVAQGRIHHELEQALVSESGPVMGGEDFRTTRTRSLDFKTPGRTGDKVWIECQFIHKHIGHRLHCRLKPTEPTASRSTSCLPPTATTCTRRPPPCAAISPPRPPTASGSHLPTSPPARCILLTSTISR